MLGLKGIESEGALVTQKPICTQNMVYSRYLYTKNVQ